MEKVFWLMYLADVVSNISAMVAIAFVLACVAALFMVLDRGYKDEHKWLSFSKHLRWLAIPVVLAVILPSSTTLRLLAVGAAGEAATSTQLGQKGLEALNAVLDQVITKAKKDVSK